MKSYLAPAQLAGLAPAERLLAAITRRALADVAGAGLWEHGENRAAERERAI